MIRQREWYREKKERERKKGRRRYIHIERGRDEREREREKVDYTKLSLAIISRNYQLVYYYTILCRVKLGEL